MLEFKMNNHLGGFVSSQEKIVKMFDSISKSYDLVNRVLTFGIDRRWRRKSIKNVFSLLNNRNLKVVDVACGTGDMIEIWKNESKKRKINIEIYGVDPSEGMLKIAKKRFPEITFYKDFADNLPFDEKSIDAISISFGIRNVVDFDSAIKEFYRVLKNNGILIILEFTKAEKNHKLRELIDFYSNNVLPKIGGILSKNKEAYEYLPKSIDRFYTPSEMIQKIENFGFKLKNFTSFNLGQVSLFIFQKN